MMNTLKNKGKVWVVLLVILGIILVVFLSIWGGYNKAVKYDVAVDGSWADVDTVLVRRFDLIPNLIETVKGYAGHEKELFENIANAKTKYFAAQGVAGKAQAANQLEGMLSKLMLLREAFPELKANLNFLKLQDQLEGTENRIAVARKRYNDAVRNVNTYKRSFFGRFYSNMAGVEKGEFFEAAEEQTAVPKVSF